MAKQRYFARPIRKSIDEIGYATLAEAEAAAGIMLGQRGSSAIAITQLVAIVEVDSVKTKKTAAADIV